MKKTLTLTLILLLLSFAAALCIHADESSLIIEDFESEQTVLTWVPVGATDELNVVEFIGGLVLRADGEATDFSKHRRIIGTFDAPRDLRHAKALSYTVYADNIPEEDSDYFARTTLYDSVGNQLEFISNFEAGKKCEISLDISSWKSNNDLVSIEISVIPEHIESGLWEGGFYIDDLAAISYPSSERIDRFSFEDYAIYGGELRFAEDNSYFDLLFNDSDEYCTLELDISGYTPISSDTLRINIENNSTCEELMIAFSDSEAYSKEVKFGIDTLNTENIYNIKVPKEGYNRRVQIRLSGNGYIRFNSIGFVSAYVSKSYITYGNISSCTLSQNGSSITISGEIGREYVPEFTGYTLKLYALDLNQRAQDFDYDSVEPIAEHGMSTKFKFTVGNDGSDPRFKKYVVKISTSPSVFVDTPTYIDQKPSSLSSSKLRAGLISQDISVAGTVGAGMTVVDVYLDRLISGSLSGHILTTAGRNSYFDKEYVSVLDSKISALTDSGVEVALRLLVKNPSSYLTYNNLSENSNSYLINLQDGNAYYALLSSVEFLAERYNGGKYGGFSSFIIGNSVNAGLSFNGAPLMSITEFVTSYADIMRLVSLSADSSGGRIKVYASLGNIYRYDFPSARNNVYDTADFINGLYEYINDEGSFPWGICIEDIAGDGMKISSAERELFVKFLNSKAVKAASINTPLIFISAADETAQALSDLINAIESGFSGIYIFKSDDEEFISLLESFNTGNSSMLDADGFDTEKYSEYIGQYIKVIKKRFIKMSDAPKGSPMGKHIYYDFNTYTGIGGWRQSFFASEVKVVNTGSAQLLEVHTDKKLYSASGSEGLAGAGVTTDSDINLALTPVISFDISALSEGKTQDDTLRIAARFISEDTVIEAYSDIPYNFNNTLYADLRSYEGIKLKSVQILADDPSASKITLYIDNIIGHSYEYNDASLSQVIMDSSKAPDDAQMSTMNQNIIIILSVFLALLLTLVIFLKLVVGKNRQ